MNANSELTAKARALREAMPKQREGEFGESTLLKAIQRGDREQLKVEWGVFKGHPFLGIRLWADSGSGYKPTQKGISIKLRELADLAEAVEKAMDLAIEFQNRRPGQ